MTLIYELELKIPRKYTCVPKVNFLGQGFTLYRYREKESDRQTDRQTLDATELITTRHSQWSS